MLETAGGEWVLIGAGVVILVLGVLSQMGKLARNGIAGVRTPTTMRTDETWRASQRAAAPLTIAMGVVLILGGAVSLLFDDDSGVVVLVACGVVLVLGLISAVIGNLAARKAL